MARLASATLLVALFGASTLVAAGPQFHPNTMKYKDNSLPNATGRSGSASLTARALIGKNNVTDLDVVATDPGQVDKVQLKIEGSNARNYNNLSGAAFHEQLQGLAAHVNLQVQANISGVDAHREDVITVTEMVKYRPDLVVASLHAPDRAVPGVPFEVDAIVREVNGDVGAHANCVLSSDGIEIDRAAGIWIDAKGSVACKFAATLSAMGAHTLSVGVNDVDPADWDDANNAASSTITIAQPFGHYNAGALDADVHQHIVFDNGVRKFESDIQSHNQWTDIYGTSTLAIDPAKMTGTYSESTDNAPVDNISYNAMTLQYRTDGPNYHCISGYNDWRADYTSMTACTSNWPGMGTLTQFHVGRQSVAVTYVAQTWDRRFRDAEGNVWYSNSTGNYGMGLQNVHFGPTVSMIATLTDGTTTIQAAPTVPLAPYSRRYGFPLDCYQSWAGVQVCDENLTTEKGVRGFIAVDHKF